MQLRHCEHVNLQVRRFFKAGYKSGNTAYEVDHGGTLTLDPFRDPNPAEPPGYDDKVLKRYGNATLSKACRPEFAPDLTDSQRARQILNMPVTERSGNCYEMSLL